MNKNRSIYKQIFREYQKDRDNAERRLKENKSIIYQKIPRIDEIDKELALTSIKLAKAIITSPNESSELLSQLSVRNEGLLAERNKLLSKLGLSDNFLKLQYNCDSCKDTGYINDVACHCFKQKLIDIAYDQSNVANIIKRESFDNFDISYYSTNIEPGMKISARDNISKIYTSCLNFTKNFNSEFNNLLFYGSPGLGKTFLCNCIAKKLLDCGNTVLYVTALELFKALEENKFNKDEYHSSKEYLDFILNVDLFILDDLGTEFPTVLSSSELFNIINTRLIKRKSTVISTNLAPSNWINQYSDRIVSRIQGNYTLFKFYGEDIRVKRKYL